MNTLNTLSHLYNLRLEWSDLECGSKNSNWNKNNEHGMMRLVLPKPAENLITKIFIDILGSSHYGSMK